MALFTDTEPDTRPRRRRGRIIGWTITLLAILGLVIVGSQPTPYAVEQPGPVFNTTGTAKYNGHNQALITIPDAKTYPTSGTLDMLTVDVDGNPEQPLSWAQVASAWFDPSEAIVPMDELYPPQQTLKQANDESTAEMTESQQDAAAAALTELKIPFTSTITVQAVEKGYPAASVLKAGDIIQTLDGKTFADADVLRTAIVAHGAGSPLTIGFLRKGVQMTAQLTPKAVGGSQPTVAIGVVLTVAYKFPITVNIKLQDVGGPSAGMMFALGIIDKLTPGELNGGKRVAGTGTISPDGAVGAIGGIRQKMYGARDAGAKYFLAPASNCGGSDGVEGHIPSGLTVFSTSTLHHSLTVLNAIASGKGLASLPTCSGK